MSEFKIKVNVELDADSLESQLKNLGEQNITVKLDGIDKIESQLKSLKNSFKNAFKIDSSFAKDINKIANAINKMNGELSGGGTSKSTSSTSRLVSEYKDLANTVEKIQKQLNKGLLDEGSISRSTALIDKLKGQMKDLVSQMSEAELSSISMFEGKLDNKHLADMNNYLNKIESTATSLGTKLKSISFDHVDISHIERIQSKLKEIQDIAKQDIDLELNVGDILSQLDRLSSEIKNLEKVENLASSFERVTSSVTDTTGEVERLSSEIKSLENVASSLDGSFDNAFDGISNDVKDLKRDLEDLSGDASNGGGGGFLGNIFGDLDDFTGSFSQFKVLELLGDSIADGISNIVSAWGELIVETDSAMRDLNKVLGESRELAGDELREYQEQVTEVAKATGQSSVDVINGTTRAIQSGIKDVDLGLEYAKQSAIFANVGNMAQEEADQILTAIMSANGGVEESLSQTSSHLKSLGSDYTALQDFIDQANYAGNNFAITTSDVGTALMRSSSALSANGVAMEGQIAMVIAMNEVMQDSAKTGNALKSISANMSGVIYGLKQGDVQANKTAKALENLTGIKLFDEQTGQVMDMYEAMSQLHDKWDDLNEAQKSAIAQTIAGKNNLTAFLALMDNWETAEQYMSEYNQGLTANSAYKENLRYLDSIQGKWNTIKENLASIGNALISSDMVKGLLDAIIAVTDALAKLASTDLGSLVLSITAVAGAFKVLTGALAVLKGGAIFQGLSKFASGLLGGGAVAKGLTAITGKVAGVTSAISGLVAYAVPGLGAVAAAVTVAYGAWKWYDTINERAIKKSEERQEQIKKEIDTENQRIQALEAVAEEYDDLHVIPNKTEEQLARYKELVNEIASIYPELVIGYDASGDPILSLNGNAEAYLSTLKEVNAEREKMLRAEEDNEGNLQKKQLEETMADLEELQKKRKELENTEDQAFTYNPALDKEIYEEALRIYEEYQNARMAINEQTLNRLQDQRFYDGLSDEYQAELDEMVRDTFDFASLYQKQGEEGVTAFLNEMHKLEKGFMLTSELTEEQRKANEELAKSFQDQKINLDAYTDSLMKNYEEQGKIDFDSMQQWYDDTLAYAERTGDIEGANAKIREMVNLIAELTGLDPVDVMDLLGIDELDVAPLTEAQKRLHSLLEDYGTSASNLGKGGLADAIEKDYNRIITAQERLMKMDRSEFSIPIAVELFSNTTGNVQDLVTELIGSGVENEVIYDVMLNVMTDIANEGEISDATIAQIAEILDMPEEEVRARFSVKTDIQNQQEIDEFLKQYDDLDLDVEAEIRAVVSNKAEAEELYNLVKQYDDEETQLKVVADFNNAKAEAMALGVSIDQLPAEKKLEYHMAFDGADEAIGNIEKIVEQMNEADGKEVRANIIAEMDDSQINMLNDALAQVDGKKATAFLQTEGALEALAECESVEEMIALIEGTDATANVNVETEGEEEIEKTNQKIDELDGKTAQADLMIETDDGNLEQTQQKLVEIDGKVYMSTWNFETNSEELVDVTNQVENIPESKTTNYDVNVNGKGEVEELGNAIEGTPDSKTSNVDANVSGKEDVNQLEQDVKNLPSDATVEVEAKVKQDSKGGILDTIKGWFGGGSSVTQTVEIKGKVTDIEMPKTTNSTIDVKGKVSDIEMPTNTNSTIDVKGKVTDIEMPTNTNATIDIQANVTGAEQINTLKTNITSLQNKTVTINVSTSGAEQVNTLNTNITNLQSKTVTVSASVTGADLVKTLSSNITSLQGKSVAITASVSGTNEVNSLKTSISGLQGKSISVTASVTGTNLVQALKSAIDTVQAKTVSVTANVTGTSQVKALTSAINSVKSKSVKVSATVSGTSSVQSLASAIANVRSKSVKVSASISKTVTETVVRKSVDNGVMPSSASAISDTPSALNSANLSNIPISASDTPSSDMSSLANTPISAKATSSNFDISKVLSSINNNVSMYKQLEEALKEIEHQLSVVDSKMESAFGQEKIQLLQRQIELYEEQQEKQHELAENERAINRELKNWLAGNGFKFYGDEITNYQQKLLAMEKNVESLKNKYDQANNATKKNETTVNKLKTQYENANAELDRAKTYLDRYLESNEKIDDASEKWWDLENAISDAGKAINETLNKKLENQIDSVSNSIDFLSSKIENLTGIEKAQYIRQQNELYKQQQNLLHQLAEQLRAQLSMLSSSSDEYAELSSQISELSTEWWELNSAIQSNQMAIFEAETSSARHEIEMLNSQIGLLDNKMNSYSGVEKIAIIEQQNNLYRQQQNLLHQLAEQLRAQLSMLDKASEEYKQLELEIAGLSSEWWDLESNITSNNNWVTDYWADQQAEAERRAEEAREKAEREREEAEREAERAREEAKRLAEEREQFERETWQLQIDTNLDEVTREVEKAKNELERLQTLFDNINETEDLNGKNRIENLKQQIKLQEEVKNSLGGQANRIKQMLSLYQSKLSKQGFKFDEEGNLANYKEQLDYLKRSLEDDNFSDIEQTVNDYLDLLIDKLPDVENEFLSIEGAINSLNNEIKELYKQQLETTREVEEEITEIYEKEYEKRLEELEDYYDERIKLLEEEKDAYKEMRDQQEYEKELNEQTEEVENLRKKLEIARRDNSIEGLKRQKELAEELAEAEESLAEYTQNKIDEDFEKNIDNEIDKLEKEQETLEKMLEEQFSEVNIAKMVAQALTTGFIEINGEVKTLQDALINSVNETADAYSAMGSVIKQELIDNLNVALDAMKELEYIYDNLDINNYGLISPDMSSAPNNYSTNSPNITVGETNITINGSVSNDILDDIENLIEQKNNEMLKSISKGL